jgi:hypothetical protein
MPLAIATPYCAYAKLAATAARLMRLIVFGRSREY